MIDGKLLIRTAESDDIVAIQQIAALSWRETFLNILGAAQIEYMLKMMYGTETLQEQFLDPSYRYYLALVEDCAAGFCGVESSKKPDIAKLHRLYILQHYQGLGIGAALLETAESFAKSAGNQTITLHVNKNNRARIFYEKNGFQITDEGVFDIGGGYVMDDFIMSKTIL